MFLCNAKSSSYFSFIRNNSVSERKPVSWPWPYFHIAVTAFCLSNCGYLYSFEVATCQQYWGLLYLRQQNDLFTLQLVFVRKEQTLIYHKCSAFLLIYHILNMAPPAILFSCMGPTQGSRLIMKGTLSLIITDHLSCQLRYSVVLQR